MSVTILLIGFLVSRCNTGSDCLSDAIASSHMLCVIPKRDFQCDVVVKATAALLLLFSVRARVRVCVCMCVCCFCCCCCFVVLFVFVTGGDCEYLCDAIESLSTRNRWGYHCVVVDVSRCNSGGDCECLCDAIAAFHMRCCREGYCVKWRHQRKCRKLALAVTTR